ncbi:hypothetical protein [Streptomyces misionensis]|uniref:hypothetical protein n=1 Tax=Streptomyces misionensis TaxID=67331 RepID=UPI003BAE634C
MAAKLMDQMLYSPGAAQVLAETRQALRSGRMDDAYRDRIGQTQHRATYWPPEQAAAFLRVHTGLMSGEFAMALIEVGEMPAGDADRHVNAQRLSHVHPAFTVRVDAEQSHAEGDGEFCWAVPVRAQRSTGRPFSAGLPPSPELAAYEVPPNCVPLEIGLTFPSRTLMHLLKHGGVARWPYQSTVVALLLNTQTGGAA